MNGNQLLLAIVLGAAVAGVGLWLMIFPRRGGRNKAKAFGMEFDFSTPALMLVLLGMGFIGFIISKEGGDLEGGESGVATEQVDHPAGSVPAAPAEPPAAGTAPETAATQDVGDEGVAEDNAAPAVMNCAGKRLTGRFEPVDSAFWNVVIDFDDGHAMHSKPDGAKATRQVGNHTCTDNAISFNLVSGEPVGIPDLSCQGARTGTTVAGRCLSSGGNPEERFSGTLEDK